MQGYEYDYFEFPQLVRNLVQAKFYQEDRESAK